MDQPAFHAHRLPRRLRHNDFMRITRPPVLRLQVDQGTLWVTVDGEPQDIEIGAGQSRVLDAHASITVGTLGGDAVFVATSLAPRPGRLRRWWLGLASRLAPLAREVAP